MSSKPHKTNLFHYASGELSQDAFICWLLNWSDSSYKDNYADLHNIGSDFLEALLKKHNTPLPIERTIKIKKQLHKVDIVVEINIHRENIKDRFILFIEDKTHTHEHDDQLKRYRKKITEEYASNILKENILPTFLKTGDQSRGCDARIEEYDNYELFKRNDFIKVLKKNTIQNNIIEDFLGHLEALQKEIDLWKETPFKDWQDDVRNCWIGLFQALEKRLDNPQYNYVPNPAGGYYVMWWHVKKIDVLDENNQPRKIEFYLQLRNDVLEFRISSKDAKDGHKITQHMRTRWVSAIKNVNTKHNIKQHGKSGGKTAAIGRVEGWCCLNEGIVDLEKTLEQLKDFEKIADKVYEEVKNA